MGIIIMVLILLIIMHNIQKGRADRAYRVAAITVAVIGVVFAVSFIWVLMV